MSNCVRCATVGLPVSRAPRVRNRFLIRVGYWQGVIRVSSRSPGRPQVYGTYWRPCVVLSLR
eukprot:4207488-Lingulodinium_polyedra.AAC.1